MTTKIKIINDAYSQLRISGLTSNATPEDVELALMRLENMMAEFNLGLPYNFEQSPDPNSLTNIEQRHWHMMATNLAVRLIADFNKDVPQAFAMQAEQSLSATMGYLAAQRAKETSYPRRHPVGSGNDRLFSGWYRYYSADQGAPTKPSVNYMTIGDVNDYQESFSALLNPGETISSFVLSPDDGLVIQSSSESGGTVSYRVEATSSGVIGLRVVKVQVTTSGGRVNNRSVNFEVSE